jgi:hypothetical protein
MGNDRPGEDAIPDGLGLVSVQLETSCITRRGGARAKAKAKKDTTGFFANSSRLLNEKAQWPSR